MCAPEAEQSAIADTSCEDSSLDDNGNFAPVDPTTDAARRIRGFLYRAQQSTFGAKANDLKGLVCTREMLEAAEDAAKAWTDVAAQLKAKVEPAALRWNPWWRISSSTSHSAQAPKAFMRPPAAKSYRVRPHSNSWSVLFRTRTDYFRAAHRHGGLKVRARPMATK